MPAAVLLVLLLLPGAALLAFLDRGAHLGADDRGARPWSGVERLLLALGLGLGLWPMLFALQDAVPGAPALGATSTAALLVLSAVVVGVDLRHRAFTLPSGIEAAALVVFAATLWTRLEIVQAFPVPAWTDSLHHVLLTQATAAGGGWPDTLAPWFPEIPVTRYHRGLYALSAPVQWLADVPAHTALHWTVQVLNGLVGAGVYLVLARRVSPVAGLVGAVAVGLLLRHPAVWVNWGRFTQLAGQILLPFAWLAVAEFLRAARLPQRTARHTGAWLATAGLLVAGVVLLHFRVALFLFLLLAVEVVWQGWLAWRAGTLRRMLAPLSLAGVFTALLLGPDFWEAVRVHLVSHWMAAVQRGSLFAVEGMRSYGAEPEFFGLPISAVPMMVARPPLLLAAGLAALIGLLRREAVSVMVLCWLVLLLALASLHRVGIPVLSLTNEGAVAIALYLPLGLLLGAGTASAIEWLPAAWQGRGQGAVVLAFLALGLWNAPERVQHIDPARFLVTPEDYRAYAWMDENLPDDAVVAVEPHFWLRRFAHPQDGGLWISWFTGRATVPGPMLSPLAPSFHRRMAMLSTNIDALGENRFAARALSRAGVDWLYLDTRRYPDRVHPQDVVAAGNGTIVYDDGGIAVLRLSGSMSAEEVAAEGRKAARRVFENYRERTGRAHPAAEAP